MITLAAAQYAIENFSSFELYQEKISLLVAEVKQSGADLLLLPEYAGIEAAGFCHTDEALYDKLQLLIPRYKQLFSELSRKHAMYIQPGTILERVASGKYRNRAYFFSPQGNIGFQDKLQLIEYEKNTGFIERGDAQSVFVTSLGKIGIAVCYDVEFPEIVRSLVFAGADIILVPSYTISSAGLHRVFLSCRARAIENQCYVAMSSVVGEVSLSKPVENAVGQAAIMSPIDIGFPDNGVLAQGKCGKVEVVSGRLSSKALQQVREHGTVRNFSDARQEMCAFNVSEFDLG
tara:strand:+ start:732 stop:1601 length:870 start_codon:yes stop_codon:yes gene_type:complete